MAPEVEIDGPVEVGTGEFAGPAAQSPTEGVSKDSAEDPFTPTTPGDISGGGMRGSDPGIDQDRLEELSREQVRVVDRAHGEVAASDTSDLSLADLKEKAAELEIEGRSSMNKEELAAAVGAAGGSSDETDLSEPAIEGEDASNPDADPEDAGGS